MISVESILFYDGKSLSKKSTAIINICKILGGWHRIMPLGLIVPKFIREGIYGIVAKNRFRWFGKQDRCMSPLKSLESRFLDWVSKPQTYLKFNNFIFGINIIQVLWIRFMKLTFNLCNKCRNSSITSNIYNRSTHVKWSIHRKNQSQTNS